LPHQLFHPPVVTHPAQPHHPHSLALADNSLLHPPPPKTTGGCGPGSITGLPNRLPKSPCPLAIHQATSLSNSGIPRPFTRACWRVMKATMSPNSRSLKLIGSATLPHFRCFFSFSSLSIHWTSSGSPPFSPVTASLSRRVFKNSISCPNSAAVILVSFLSLNSRHIASGSMTLICICLLLQVHCPSHRPPITSTPRMPPKPK